jgi:hypothetical protein
MAEIEATCAGLATIGMNAIERRRLQALHERMSILARQADHAPILHHVSVFENAFEAFSATVT